MANATTAFALNQLAQYRVARDDTQASFWSRFGVTQSGGSRYEKRPNTLPVAVVMLLLMHADELLADEQLAIYRDRAIALYSAPRLPRRRGPRAITKQESKR
jgi:hypothetical protein